MARFYAPVRTPLGAFLKPYVWIIFIFLFSDALLFGQTQPDLATRIIELNRQIEARQQSGSPAPASSLPLPITKVLEARSALVDELIRTQPGAIRCLMLDTQVAARLRAAVPEAAPLIEAEGEWTGRLGEVVAEDFRNKRSKDLWVLHGERGHIELSFTQTRQLKPYVGQHVKVTGVGTSSVIAVEKFEVLVGKIESSADASPLTCATTGPQNIAVLIVNMSGGSSFPTGMDQTSYWDQVLFSSTPKSVNTFLQETSYGQASATGQVFGPFTLDQVYTCYQTSELYAAAINAATATVDFSSYPRIIVVFPEANCPYGGLAELGCVAADSLIAHPYSAVYIPILPTTPTGWARNGCARTPAGISFQGFTDTPYGMNLAYNPASDVSPMHFTGKQMDAETGNDYFGARYFASGTNLGRFLTPDWAAKATSVPYADFNYPQSLNLYGYVRNNPLATADADGHCEIICVAVITGAVVLAATGYELYNFYEEEKAKREAADKRQDDAIFHPNGTETNEDIMAGHNAEAQTYADTGVLVIKNLNAQGPETSAGEAVIGAIGDKVKDKVIESVVKTAKQQTGQQKQKQQKQQPQPQQQQTQKQQQNKVPNSPACAVIGCPNN